MREVNSALFGTRELAHKFGVSQKSIRRILRAFSRYQRDGYTRYQWPVSEFDRIVAEIEKSSTKFRSQCPPRFTSKGQIVIPVAIRKRYQIRRGTPIRIEEREEGILLRPLTGRSISKVRGILAGYDLPDTVEKELDRDLE